MTNTTNGFSSSQGSTLFDDETFSEIQTDLKGSLCSSLSFLLDDKDLFAMSSSGLKRISNIEEHSEMEWKRVKKEEAEEMFTPLPEITQQLDDTFAGHLNFQYTFADNGTSQDWAKFHINCKYKSLEYYLATFMRLRGDTEILTNPG